MDYTAWNPLLLSTCLINVTKLGAHLVNSIMPTILRTPPYLDVTLECGHLAVQRVDNRTYYSYLIR